MKSHSYRGLPFVVVLLTVLSFLIACAPGVPTAPSPSSKTPVSKETTSPVFLEGTVTEVVDNCIIKVSTGGTTHSVRYIGIDTLVPYRPSKPLEYYSEQCYNKSSELLKDKTVRLEKDVSETDKSGHLLRYVWVGTMMVNAELVRQGYAMVVGTPPDIKYYDVLVKAQLEAQSEGRGLWLEEKEKTKKLETQQEFWGQTGETVITKIYHYPYCPLLVSIKGSNIVVFMSVAEARARGYRPCNVCKPP